jgi:hypothetical protein
MLMSTPSPVNYFETDAKFVGEAARDDRWVFLRTILMVLLSIRQPWLRVPIQFQDVVDKGISSPALFGFKRDGYSYAIANMNHLHGAVKKYEGDLDSLLVEFMKIPGLGLAKASFLAQLTVNDGACLDGHNLRRIGKSPSFTRLDKNAKNVKDKIVAYNEAWREHGDSAYWWNTWCDFMGERYHKTGEEISLMHRLPVLA